MPQRESRESRKAKIREYKETPRPMGVYRVRNTRDDRSLVGSSANVNAILNRHRAQLGFGSHRNLALQADWNEHGQDAFVFEVLDTLEHRDEPGYDPSEDLEALEAMWIDKLAEAAGARY